MLAINLAHLGEIEEASAALDECERLKPGFAKNWVRDRQYRKPSDVAHLMDGLRKAGMSDTSDV